MFKHVVYACFLLVMSVSFYQKISDYSITQTIAGLSPCIPDLNLRPIRVRFVVDRVTLTDFASSTSGFASH